MPNRILKETICSSESIQGLSWFEEAVFYRLIVTVDDYGRYDGRPTLLQARLFPLKKVSASAVARALDRLEEAGMVTRYEVDGHAYLQLTGWLRHQSPRAKNSKFPAPQADDFFCGHLLADVPGNGNETDSIIEDGSGNGTGCPTNPFLDETL